MSDTLTLPPPTGFKAVVHTEPEGGYWAEVPDLPGCFTQGDTLDEVYRNLGEAIASHLGTDPAAVRVGAVQDYDNRACLRICKRSGQAAPAARLS